MTEASLFPFEHMAQRFQWTTTWSCDRTTTTTVVDQSINGFLEHPFFVLHDDTRGIQLKQTCQTVVPVDHTAVKIVQVRGSKTATIQLDHRTKIWWNNWKDVENHPFWLVARFVEGIQDIQTTHSLHTFLTSCSLQFFFQESNFSFQIHLFQEVLDRFCTHLSHKRTWSVFTQAFTVFTFRHDGFVLKWCIFWIDHHVSCEVNDFFKGTRAHIQGQSHTRRDAFEVPDV